MAEHNSWTTQEKASQLLAILHRQAVNMLYSVPAEMRYECIIEVLEG
jgi:hypothetical protein